MAAKDYISAVSPAQQGGGRKKPSLKPLPVGYAVYHAISELNRSFEESIQSLERLTSFSLFPRDCLRAYQVMIEEVRALANEELIDSLHPRELHNTFHYEGLRLKWQGQFRESLPRPRRHDQCKSAKPRKAVRQ